MMKRFFTSLAAVLLVFSASTLYAQRYTSCDTRIELLGGLTLFGYVGQVGLVKQFNNRIYLKLDGLYSREIDRGLIHKVWGGDVTVGLNVLRLKETFFLNIIGGGTFSTEASQGNKYQLKKYGVLGGIECDYYINNKFSIFLNVQERYFFGENKLTEAGDILWGNHRLYAMVGVRFHIYGAACIRSHQPNSLQRSR